MRVSLGKKAHIYPQPVLVVASYDENNNPDIMLAVRGGVSDIDKIFICIDHNHKTMENILKQKVFTVSIGTSKYVKNIDYVGLVSLHSDQEKIQKSKFTTTKSQLINAPLINELPLTLECQLISFDESTDYLFARIINVSCEDYILKDNKRIDLEKLDPLIYDTSNHKYVKIGEIVGDAFKDGKVFF